MARERVPALTILAHPQVGRVGDRATLLGLAAGETVPLSRVAPAFSPPAGGAPHPLADPFLSRAPLATLELHGGLVSLRRDRDDVALRVSGQSLAEARAFEPDELDDGVVLELGDRCALLLHLTDAVPGRRPPAFGLVGESCAVQRLRRDIARVAATDLRVLLRGETGSGKELVARAIHEASARAGGPFVAVNMGAIQPSLAASALFGHTRGSFTGAVADHDGHMLGAHQGTLFLDEIGDTDGSVQALLLRALETSEIQRVGERRTRKVDVRLLSATDADIEAAVVAGKLREPLLHRIGELTLRVPPLRARRDDIGRLVVAILREVLDPAEQARLLDDETAERPWLPAAVVARLARARWPGNVRQLRNVVRQLAVLCRDEPALALSADIEESLRDATPSIAAPSIAAPPIAAPPIAAPSTGVPSAPATAVDHEQPRSSSPGLAAPERAQVEGAAASASASSDAAGPRAKGKRPQDLTEAEILDALEKTGWRRAAAADLLGIARSSLYAILASSKSLVRAHDLTQEQIDGALARHAGDVALAAADLHVSQHGLKLRIQALSSPGRRP